MYVFIPIHELLEDDFGRELWDTDQHDPFDPDPEFVIDDDNVPFEAGVAP